MAHKVLDCPKLKANWQGHLLYIQANKIGRSNIFLLAVFVCSSEIENRKVIGLFFQQDEVGAHNILNKLKVELNKTTAYSLPLSSSFLPRCQCGKEYFNSIPRPPGYFRFFLTLFASLLAELISLCPSTNIFFYHFWLRESKVVYLKCSRTAWKKNYFM